MTTIAITFQGLGPRQGQKAMRAYNDVMGERWKSVERVASASAPGGYVDFIRTTIHLGAPDKPPINAVAHQEASALAASFPVVDSGNLKAYLVAATAAKQRAVAGRPFEDKRQPSPAAL
jgi:hypothetical protein